MRKGGELEDMLGLAAAIFGIELSHTHALFPESS